MTFTMKMIKHLQNRGEDSDGNTIILKGQVPAL